MGNVQNFLILISQSQVSSENWLIECGPRLPMNRFVTFPFPSYCTLAAAFVIMNSSNVSVACLTAAAVSHCVFQSGVCITAIFSDENILFIYIYIYIY